MFNEIKIIMEKYFIHCDQSQMKMEVRKSPFKTMFLHCNGVYHYRTQKDKETVLNTGKEE